jgi:hypothetical protein
MKLHTGKMNKASSKGAVLLLAMIFLLLLAMVAGTVMQNSILSFRMAGNDQFREEAFQKAQGIVSAISEDQDNFPVSGGVGYIICKDNTVTAGCSADFAPIDPDVVTLPAGVTIDYQIERQGPLLLETIPFRLSQDSTSSSLAYDAAIFEAKVEVDGSAVGLGKAQVVQGVAIVIATTGGH